MYMLLLVRYVWVLGVMVAQVAFRTPLCGVSSPLPAIPEFQD